MPGCSVQTADNATVPAIGMHPFRTQTSRWMAHMPTWPVRNVIPAEVLEDYQRTAFPVMRNLQGIMVPTVHPATVPVIGMHLLHTPTPVVAAALITIGRRAPTVTRAAIIPLRIAGNVMAATIQVAAKN
jgi:hypothetical protein